MSAGSNSTQKNSLEKHGFDLAEYAGLALRWRNMPLHKKAESIYNATPLINLRGLAHLLGMSVEAFADAMRSDDILRSVVNDNMAARYSIADFVPAAPNDQIPEALKPSQDIKPSKPRRPIKAGGKISQCIEAIDIIMGIEKKPWPGVVRLKEAGFFASEISEAIKILRAEGKLIGLGHKMGYRWVD